MATASCYSLKKRACHIKHPPESRPATTAGSQRKERCILPSSCLQTPTLPTTPQEKKIYLAHDNVIKWRVTVLSCPWAVFSAQVAARSVLGRWFVWAREKGFPSHRNAPRNNFLRGPRVQNERNSVLSFREKKRERRKGNLT